MTQNPFSLEGKTILVTGASSGIGRSIAVLCSRMGAHVIVTARREEELSKTLDMMSEGCRYFVADLTNADDVEKMTAGLPKLDGVVHCAGVMTRSLCKTITKSDVEKTMNINFVAPVMLQKNIMSAKKLNKAASIVFIASLGADSPSVGNAIYSASKAALISYSQCLALEVAPRDIRVNCISPAMVWTDLLSHPDIDITALKEDESRYPLKRYGQPEDIAPLAVYLLSDASRWMTTSNIKIDGGYR